VKERNSLVLAAVVAAGIEPNVQFLQEAATTAAAAAQQLGCEVGAIANSLVFVCDGHPLLVMASGSARVDTDLLADELGATEIAKASASFVRSATGQVIGGVAPAGHPSPLPTVVDESLASYPLIWAAAGTADTVMSMTYDELLDLTKGTAMRVR
jgi:prolyl-tRNA editing enzyme YbaK/EbsC (Cys-tRNA(Pro) deacylase)